ncbi:MAG: heme NO-binding domain-containing protein [Armatimonadota bacterium]|nr:heme NO-binding domain-containing protein [bacterium]MDW8322385.1 heme NO-binding domain-containing protein [Armatimonadota bacterium]
MKGTIVIAVREMVQQQFGKDAWTKALLEAGIDKEPAIAPSSMIDDKVVINVIQGICRTTGKSMQQFADMFGEYWVTQYAQRMYKSFFLGSKCARDFLLKMDSVHVSMTRAFPDSTPPRFEYEWKSDNTLIMTYKSPRGLMDIFIGLIKGVGKHYGENLQVRKITSNQVEIVFPKAA